MRPGSYYVHCVGCGTYNVSPQAKTSRYACGQCGGVKLERTAYANVPTKTVTVEVEPVEAAVDRLLENCSDFPQLQQTRQLVIELMKPFRRATEQRIVPLACAAKER